ncbi:MAG: type II toxin-antitoxin system PemK/MazF family toxin [Anaerolineales bacterium]|nr:type II toxin-antitoxin system PemK/MazF family toxin [Anaerolineales bacterium]MBX3037654.1 type II toxin-antitoxin system PemK/MazF family toxin [Anaerolineales bacterium]
MNIKKGDVFWVSPNETNQIESDYAHPCVVIQEDTSNKLIVCTLTSNLKKAKFIGNILLEADEANLPKQSVIEVAKVFTINKTQLGEYIGTLAEQRIHQVLAGMNFIQAMTQHHE